MLAVFLLVIHFGIQSDWSWMCLLSFRATHDPVALDFVWDMMPWVIKSPWIRCETTLVGQQGICLQRVNVQHSVFFQSSMWMHLLTWLHMHTFCLFSCVHFYFILSSVKENHLTLIMISPFRNSCSSGICDLSQNGLNYFFTQRV